MSSPLLEPLEFGPFKLKNRLMMTGMTRCRSDASTGAPNALVQTYYTQRAESAAIIVTEAMAIHPFANPWPGAASVFTQKAVEAWKPITAAVHEKNCVFFAGIFHCGRAQNSEYSNGHPPFGPSDAILPGEMYVNGVKKPHSKPVAMTQADIDHIKLLYEIAFNNARAAGFDGVEVEAHSGFLLDSFLKSHPNNRTDKYGGSVENRARLLLEVVDVAMKIWPAERIGVKFSAAGRYNDVSDENPVALFNYVCKELSRRKILYIAFIEGDNPEGKNEPEIPNVSKQFWDAVGPDTFVICNKVSIEEGERRLKSNETELVAFARNFISNPDLADRIRNKWPIANSDMATWYYGGEKGYTDYPKYKA